MLDEENDAPPSPTRLTDVARLAGVSTATASFVLNGQRKNRPKPASAETVSRVQQAAQQLGYVPNRFAQSIRKGYSEAIVLEAGLIDDPWASRIALSVATKTQGEFTTLSLASDTWYEFLRGYSPRSALITSADFSADGLHWARHLADLGRNLVIFSVTSDPEKFDVIASSPTEAIGEAYAKLRARHPRVVLFSGRPADSPIPGPTRVSGFRQAVEHHGDNFEGSIFFAQRKSWSGHQAAVELLSSSNQPTAVIASNAALAARLLDAALGLGLRIPDDLEIIAIGDLSDSEYRPFGPISYHGTRDVFDRISDIVVHRSRVRDTEPFYRTEFVWEYFPGATTID